MHRLAAAPALPMAAMAPVVAVLAAAACGGGPPVGEAAASAPALRAPAEAEIPSDSLGASIRRGLALLTATSDSLPSYAPANVNCTSCHLGAGRVADAAPLVGAHARFPRYLDRSGAVVGLADRVNYCFTRSLSGRRLPADSREMQDILAYIAWLSRDVAPSEAQALPGATGLPAMPVTLAGDRARGEQVYATRCAVCHLPDGEGNRNVRPPIPALWGPASFSVGASMARQSRAASFIWHNMPMGMGRTLTHQEAYDVAAYITSQPRPDSPGKERDWPAGGAPADVPYATRGREAFQPPPLLPRTHAAEAIVPNPRSARPR